MPCRQSRLIQHLTDIDLSIANLSAGPSRLRERLIPTPVRSTTQGLNSQLQASQTAASLLRPAAQASKDVVWSTGSREIDKLVVQPHSILNGTKTRSNGISSESGSALMSAVRRKSRQNPLSKTVGTGEGKQGIRPGYLMEIASPPGGGKSCLAVNVALNARMEQEDDVEVLIVGECFTVGKLH